MFVFEVNSRFIGRDQGLNSDFKIRRKLSSAHESFYLSDWRYSLRLHIEAHLITRRNNMRYYYCGIFDLSTFFEFNSLFREVPKVISLRIEIRRQIRSNLSAKIFSRRG